MRKVWDADMVAHLWANRSRWAARTPTQNLYFTGPTLFSYGSHFVIGHWLDTADGIRLLWNDGSYSKTTSKQQSAARAAVRRFDWERAVHVPSLDSNGVRNLRAVADDCVKSAMHELEHAEKGRATSAKFARHVAQARTYLASARELYTIAGSNKAAGAVPTLAHFDGAQDPKETIRAILKAANAAEHIARAESLLARADEALRAADRCAAGATSDYMHSRGSDGFHNSYNAWDAWGTPAQGVMHHVSAARSLIADALGQYRLADKKSTRAANMLRKCAELATKFEEQATADRIEGLRDAVRIFLPDLQRAFSSYCRPAVEHRPRRNPGYGVHRTAEQVRTNLDALGAEHVEFSNSERAAAAFLARVEKRLACDRLAHILASVREDLKAWSEEGHEPPALPTEVRDALRHARDIPAHWINQARDIATQVTQAQDQWERERTARNAAAIAQWRAGAPVRPSQDWPTVARIFGDTVQTSRGAVVPIEHACRLARIARRVIAAGGKEWDDGAGPMVGHFRVERIGADGSARIGCHEFSADEGMRLLALLESCAACAQVTEPELAK